MMLERRPELLNGSKQRALLEHHCRELRGADRASSDILWDSPMAPSGAHCQASMCIFRGKCAKAMAQEAELPHEPKEAEDLAAA